jgi:hypothetical protein
MFSYTSVHVKYRISNLHISLYAHINLPGWLWPDYHLPAQLCKGNVSRPQIWMLWSPGAWSHVEGNIRSTFRKNMLPTASGYKNVRFHLLVQTFRRNLQSSGLRYKAGRSVVRYQGWRWACCLHLLIGSSNPKTEAVVSSETLVYVH